MGMARTLKIPYCFWLVGTYKGYFVNALFDSGFTHPKDLVCTGVLNLINNLMNALECFWLVFVCLC